MRIPHALCALLLALLLSVLAHAGGADAPGTRIGWVDATRVYADSRVAAQRLAGPQKKLNDAYAASQKQIEDLDAAYRRATTEAERNRLKDERVQAVNKYAQDEQALRGALESARQGIATLISDGARTLGQRDGYAAILDGTTLPYARADLDVTREVIALIDARSEGKPKGK